MRDILPELNGKEYYQEIYKEYDIHFCKEEEVDELIEFLKKYWKENHIFVLSRKLFDWQHYDAAEHRYNYVVAKHKVTNEIHSILGFVPTSQFDKEIKNMEIWPCIWKSRDDVKVKGLGIILYYYLKENLPIETISILGISEIALSIYKHWNFETGKIHHYYMMNESLEQYQLMSGYEGASKYEPAKIDEDIQIKEYGIKEYEDISEDAEIFSCLNKYKSKKYYIHRFFEHPSYQYQFIGMEKNGKLLGIIIARKCGKESNYCLRIVDYIGSIKRMQGSRAAVMSYLKKNNYEYIDFVEVGLNAKDLNEAGFVDKKSEKGLIIPNYFEPFLMENIALDYAFKTVVEDSKEEFFKADADQDRPNIL